MGKGNNTQIGLAGEYAVHSLLALRGFDAAMTLGNTKKVDILIRNARGGQFALEVKTAATSNETKKSKDFGHFLGWQMSEKNEEVDKDLYYCFVKLDKGLQKSQFLFYRQI